MFLEDSESKFFYGNFSVFFPKSLSWTTRVQGRKLLFKVPINYTFSETVINFLCNEPLIMFICHNLKCC